MGLGIEAQALWLLIIAAAVAMFTKYIRLPVHYRLGSRRHSDGGT